MDSKENSSPSAQSSDGGLYKNLSVSTRVLNLVIIGGLALIILLSFLGTRNSGYTVSYNSKGGSDVESQIYAYQEELVLPDNPEREGYHFEGWYLDENCTVPAEQGMVIEGSTELYAGWTAR